MGSSWPPLQVHQGGTREGRLPDPVSLMTDFQENFCMHFYLISRIRAFSRAFFTQTCMSSRELINIYCACHVWCTKPYITQSLRNPCLLASPVSKWICWSRAFCLRLSWHNFSNSTPWVQARVIERTL